MPRTGMLGFTLGMLRAHRTARLLSLVLFLIAASARVAFAAPEDGLGAAREAFFEGVRAQEAGRYREALERFADARRKVVSPPLLFNIARCHEELGEHRAALDAYRSALALAHAENDIEVRDGSIAKIAALEKLLPRVYLRLPNSARRVVVMVDGATLRVDDGAPLLLDPGAHSLSVRSEEHERTFERALELAAGDVREVPVDLGPLREASPPRDSAPRPVVEPEKRSYTPAIITGAATLAVAGVAIATGFVGKDKRDRFDELNADPTPANRAEREDLRADGSTLYVVSTVLVAGAIVLAGVTTYFLIRPPTKKRVAPLATRLARSALFEF